MGNCKSTTAAAPQQKRVEVDVTTNANNNSNNHSTAALFRSLFTISNPVLRKVISKQLIEQVGVLKEETKVTAYTADAELPILPLEIDFENIHIIDSESLEKDMKLMPDFEWPLKEKVSLLIKNMENFSKERQEGLLCLDIDNFQAKISFEKGYKITLPVEGPFGKSGELEIGTSPDMPQAWIGVQVPKVRIWFVTHTSTLYLAFLGRPDLKPHVHINADFGRGNFLNSTITEDGSLDDVVERILSGFGPQEYTKANSKTSKAGNMIGDLIVSAMGRFGQVGNGRPIIVELKDQIQASLDAALHIQKYRPVAEIKASMALLEQELEASKRHYQEEKGEDDDKVLAQPKDPPPTGYFCASGIWPSF
jgi:hypothetical protein